MNPFDLRLWPKFKEAGGNLNEPAIIDQITVDSRRVSSANALFIALKGNTHNGHQFVKDAERLGARYALVRNDWDPIGISKHTTLLYVENPLMAFQELARIYRKQLNCKIVAITGSYGKTMVKDLLHAMTKSTRNVVSSPESFNSQIGVPLSLFRIRNEHEIAFIEAAISQKGEMDRLANMIAPDCCILTHIGKKHVATLGNLKTIGEETMKLLYQVHNSQWILTPDCPEIAHCFTNISCSHYFWNRYGFFSPLERSKTSKIQAYGALPHAKLLSAEQSREIPYRIDFPDGNHHLGHITFGFYYFLDLINIAIKAAWLLGVPSDDICASLKNYTPEPMRTEIWKAPIGAIFISDTYCSDPQSIVSALKYLNQTPRHNQRIFVFGGIRSNKQYPKSDYKHIGRSIKDSKIDSLILTGNHDFTPLIEEVQSGSPETNISLYSTYQEAFTHLLERLKIGDTVLIKGENKVPLNTIIASFNDSIGNNQCTINLASIEANMATIRNKLPSHTRIMIMVKALAYGTDDVRISNFLSTIGIDILGVSCVDEGVALKRAGVKQTIFVINAGTYEAAKIVKSNLEVGVSEKTLIKSLAREALKQDKLIKVHLHIDTGMSRFGCRSNEALPLARLILDCPSLKFEGLMTHFACADIPSEDAFTLTQVHRFREVIKELSSHGIAVPWHHIANSAGVARFDFPDFNMVRIGLAVFGLHASEATKNALELRLALSLLSRIVGINICNEGETVSYGRSYKIEEGQKRIAVLPLGYFDGLHRNYSGKSHVIIRGIKAPMVGKICMDFMMVDITHISNAAIGDPVLIFGEDEYGQYLSPEELASQGDSITHELITCLGPRIQRIFIYEENQRLH